mmetsp:Transcript_16707/g.41351  ORF Transcript_16707/g.41351 Transcript_16707/m.41351 type:complete len:615 (+) Transcript_16707:249-2093(+)|eukprot:CAMPEP_0178999332 /NCGR_PEP_ID=MMETSP0795-20121207/9993_1 /TAXON_ID=88552 /ORGANISM="Amoebophrya sp., Strain Ameob2" /LENGTH=614 /DNA_ID=CAMNT_0020692077 /DNA_START=175 /DNA_END=2019 /DNA_ORIENTATION=+
MATRNTVVPLLPGYRINHPMPVKGEERKGRSQKLTYFKNTMFDFPVPAHEPAYDAEEAKELCATMEKPDWRFTEEMKQREFVKYTQEELQAFRREEAVPSNGPAWIKHDKQVCRFFAYTQESVTESDYENARIRYVTIIYFLEDGTMQLTERKIENSGIMGGALLKRHCIMKEDNSGTLGLDDLKCGTNLEVYSRVYRIVACDAFTRWYYEKNGIDAGVEEDVPLDNFAARKKAKKDHDEKPTYKEVVDGKIYNEKFIGGNRGTNDKLEQFLKNDLRVLRFYCYWDDHTVYGTRTYYTLSFFLADNSIQIADNHIRNSGRDPYPVFFKKGPLKKNPLYKICPGMLEPTPENYLPADLEVGGKVSVFGRDLFVYDCDPFTREFYKTWYNKEQTKIEVPEPHDYTMPMPIPPHVGVGTEEDSLGGCLSVTRPKPPKQDLRKKMTKAAMILRFEAEIANPTYPEDTDRKFIIAYYLGTDTIGVYEMKRRNSGFMEGKFAHKERKRNPETGEWYKAIELYVGNLITVSSVQFRLLRPDEYTLAYMEQHPEDFPLADVTRSVAKLKSYLETEGLGLEGCYSPDDLQKFGCLVDQEIITLLRKYCTPDSTDIDMKLLFGA